MPELPEVESVRCYLTTDGSSILNQTIKDILIHRESVVDGEPALLNAVLIGDQITAVERHGKYLFFRTTGGQTLAMHLRMTGRCLVTALDQPPASHARLTIVFSHCQLHFIDPRAFGRVWLVESPEVVIRSLGPDGLSVDGASFMAGLARRSDSSMIKPVLLDQSFVAGIGNIYADESLYRAGIHPERRLFSLSACEREQLFHAVSDVLTEAVLRKGANIDGVFEAGHFPVAVYGRSGEPCFTCGSQIEKIKVAQRGTHFCRTCQPPQLANAQKKR